MFHVSNYFILNFCHICLLYDIPIHCKIGESSYYFSMIFQFTVRLGKAPSTSFALVVSSDMKVRLSIAIAIIQRKDEVPILYSIVFDFFSLQCWYRTDVFERFCIFT